MSLNAIKEVSAVDIATSSEGAESLITEHLDLWTSAIIRKNSTGRGSNQKYELYGIKKLRELVLELAVRGKLVPQDLNDEPASELLERVKEERALLVAQGKTKKPKKLPDITDNEKPFEIPFGWAWTRLGDIGHDWGQKVPDTEFTYIDVGAIDRDLGAVRNPNTLVPADAPSRARKLVRVGTIIYSTVRPYLLNVAVIDREFNLEPIASTAFAVLHPVGGVSSRYVYRYLRSPVFVSYVESCQTGIAYPAINDKQFYSGVIAMPPLGEQHRIAAKVDELMALCDQLENQTEQSLDAHATLVDTLLDALTRAQSAEELAENWQRLEEHWDILLPDTLAGERAIDKLKQTILQLAVMGKLVPQDPNDEPASELLKRIAAEKEQLIKEKKIKRQKPLRPFDDEEKPFDIPKGWSWTRFGSIGYDLGGGTPSKSNEKYWNGHIPWVSPKDMKMAKIAFTQDYVTELALKFSSVKLIPVGSLLMVVRGMILSHSFPVAITQVPVVINQDMKALVFSEVDSDFLLLMLKGRKGDIVKLVERSSHGTCKLVSDSLWGMVVGIPPIEEQRRIVAEVDRLMTLCEQFKDCLQALEKNKVRFSDAVNASALADS